MWRKTICCIFEEVSTEKTLKNMFKHIKFALNVEKKIFAEFSNESSLLRLSLEFLCVASCRAIYRSHFFTHPSGVGGEDKAYSLVEVTSWCPQNGVEFKS